MAQAFRSTRVVTGEGVRPATVVVKNGRISAVAGMDNVDRGMDVTDFGDDVLLPGLVDTHVHINEPGRTEWEGFVTGTRAAAAGGITTVVDMPLNCLPETTTVAALEVKRAAAVGKCMVDWASWGGAVADNQTDILPLARAGVPGFKCFLIYPGCDGFTMIDRAQLEAALPAIAESGLPLLVHAELAEPIDAATKSLVGADWRRYATYLASRPDAAEVQAIVMMLALCRKYKFRLHIVHLATAQGLEILRAAKAEGLAVTVETCPHYLHFAAEEIADGATLTKCAPPVRNATNREALWQGLRDGVIDMVVTDHSPCPPEMKGMEAGRFDAAWGGIASLSVALPLMGTEASRRGFGLEDVARWMSAAPAKLAGLQERVGAIAVGMDANFCVFDDAAEFEVRAEGLHYRHAVSPYMGMRLRGVVKATYLRGERVFAGGEFAAIPPGREYRLC